MNFKSHELKEARKQLTLFEKQCPPEADINMLIVDIYWPKAVWYIYTNVAVFFLPYETCLENIIVSIFN